MRNQSACAAPETLVLTGLEGASKVKNFGLDHGVGHPMPFESTPWLAEAG